MHHLACTLQRSEGYCDLSMWQDARRELASLSVPLRSHPDARWRELKILLGEKHWDKAATLGLELCANWPARAAFFLETTFALEQAGRINECLELLRTAPAHLWQHAEAWYSLACINARMAEVAASRMALGRCFEIDQNWKFTAMYEPALATLALGPLPA